MKKNTLIIGTRSSKLALIYAEKVKKELGKINDDKIFFIEELVTEY